MKTFCRLLCSIITIACFSATNAAAQLTPERPVANQQSAERDVKPNVVILATGGTIVSSTNSATDMTNYSGPLAGVDSLLRAVPQIHNYANVKAEQVVNVGSNVISSETVLKLAKRAIVLLADPNVDAIVVTHGTDTMEETAYFLSLVTKTEKPIVVTGSMRPATSLSADGPVNLLDAVMVAANPESRDRGVMVVMNDRISSARYVTKLNTLNTATMGALEQGYLGAVAGGRVVYYYRSTRPMGSVYFNVAEVSTLPNVALLYRYQGQEMRSVRDAVQAGAEGVVIAFTGNGSSSDEHEELIQEFASRGIPVVRASRTPSGVVTQKTTGSMASGLLSPQKARIFLMLAMTQTRSLPAISQYFKEQ